MSPQGTYYPRELKSQILQLKINRLAQKRRQTISGLEIRGSLAGPSSAGNPGISSRELRADHCNPNDVDRTVRL